MPGIVLGTLDTAVNKQNPFLHDPVVLKFLVGEDKQ